MTMNNSTTQRYDMVEMAHDQIEGYTLSIGSFKGWTYKEILNLYSEIIPGDKQDPNVINFLVNGGNAEFY